MATESARPKGDTYFSLPLSQELDVVLFREVVFQGGHTFLAIKFPDLSLI